MRTPEDIVEHGDCNLEKTSQPNNNQTITKTDEIANNSLINL